MNSSNRLTTDGRLKFDPVFVRGGEEIVFTQQETPTLWALMRLKLADRSIERLHPQAVTNEFEPAFSADGRYCVFVQSRGNLNLKMVIRDTKENRDAAFDPGGGFAGMRHPTIAPDNSRIVFSLPGAGGQILASVSMTGQDKRTLTQGGFNHWPAFSPDGKQIVFGSSRDGYFNLYAMKSDGSAVRRLTKRDGMDLRPAWSPDGRRITYTANVGGRYRLRVMNADGTGVRTIATESEREDYAAWHPDGKRVVVVSERGGRFDLYLVDVL